MFTKKMFRFPIKYLGFITILVSLLSACMAPTQVESTLGSSQATPTSPILEPSPTETTKPEKVVTICTSGLPNSLFLYDGYKTPIKQEILSMVLEPVFILLEDELLPNILVKTPSQLDGDLRLEPVPVQRGQTVVNALGDLVVLKPGVELRPSGCRGSECVITWEGDADLMMDRMVVDYQLRDDLVWSDGTQVAAGDVLFSYQLASDPEAPGLKWAEDRTEDLIALDQSTVEWVGRPGFTTANLDQFFWHPLPSHLFSDSESWASIAQSDQMANYPLSYGPFVVSNWDVSNMGLIRNPYYSPTSDGLPALDRVIFQVIDGGSRAAWDAIQSGICDVIDESFDLEDDLGLVAEIQSDPRFNVLIDQRNDWTQLVFGIQPASYDEFYNPVYGDRPDFFGDARARQAIAACLDRENMLDVMTNGLGEIWPSFMNQDASQLGPDERITYDPILGKNLLNEVGWVDHDNDPQTPLQAWRVTTVPNGTPFSIELAISQSDFQQGLGSVIQSSLSQCGIEVKITSLPASELYALGPEGPLFGRSFDLTILSWTPMPDLDCRYYLTNQVPVGQNTWIGTNIAGFMDKGYDEACGYASLSLPVEQQDALLASEIAFIDGLPAVPLFSLPQVKAVYKDCNFDTSSHAGGFYQLIREIDIYCP